MDNALRYKDLPPRVYNKNYTRIIIDVNSLFVKAIKTKHNDEVDKF